MGRPAASVVVRKFGGAALADAEAIQHAAGIVAARPSGAIVVASAMQGVTRLMNANRAPELIGIATLDPHTRMDRMTITLSFHADAYPAGTRHPAHSHEELHFSLVLSGRVAETVGSVTEYAGALSVVAKDAGVLHANDFGTAGAKLARLILPSGTIGALVDKPSQSPGWRWTHDARVANPFLRLVHRANDGVRAFDSDDPDLLDLLAAFTARPAPAPRGRPPAWLEETMQELRASWHPGLRVADVARLAGVHPVYLARSVRRWFGTGVGEEIRRLRLRSVTSAIAESDRTVSNVAHSGGFADEAHLCREFHRAIGTTPGRYRGLVRSLDYQQGGRR